SLLDLLAGIQCIFFRCHISFVNPHALSRAWVLDPCLAQAPEIVRNVSLRFRADRKTTTSKTPYSCWLSSRVRRRPHINRIGNANNQKPRRSNGSEQAAQDRDLEGPRGNMLPLRT